MKTITKENTGWLLWLISCLIGFIGIPFAMLDMVTIAYTMLFVCGAGLVIAIALIIKK